MTFTTDGDLYAAEFRRCLVELDVSGVRKIWAHVRPDCPAGNDDEVLSALHVARTAAESIPSRLRLYSHHWCLDRGLPSRCPFEVWSRERPRIVSAVGIAVHSEFPEVASAVRGAMEAAVLEAYADGREDDPLHVRSRMDEARTGALRALGLARGT